MAKKKKSKSSSKKNTSKKKTKKSSKKSKSKKKSSKKTKKPTKVKNKNKSSKPTEVRYHSTKEIKVEKALVDNFIGLQKVMVNLSSKFDKLSDEISKLLNIFEVSAKAMAKKEFQSEKDPQIKKIHDRLDNLSKQAGLIGKGLALVHEANMEGHEQNIGMQMGGKFEPHPSSLPRPQPPKMPLGPQRQPQPPQRQGPRPNPNQQNMQRQPPKLPQQQGQQPQPGQQQGEESPDEGTQTREIGGGGNMQPSIMPSEAEMAKKNINQNQIQGQAKSASQEQTQSQPQPGQQQGQQNAQ